MPVSTISKYSSNPIVSNQKQNSVPTNEKIKKSKTVQTNPILSDPSTTSKTLIVSDTIEYNIVEDMKKIKENISLHEMTKLKQQQKILLRELKAIPAEPIQPLVIEQASKDMGKPPSSTTKVDSNDLVLICDRCIS